MRTVSVLRLVGAAAVMASVTPALSQAQNVRLSVGLGRATNRASVGYYPSYPADLFAGIYITPIQQERLDAVSYEYGYQNPLNNPDELWAMRQVLGPGERLVFDENVDALTSNYGYSRPVYNPDPWYRPYGIGVRIGFPRTVILNGRSRGDDERGREIYRAAPESRGMERGRVDGNSRHGRVDGNSGYTRGMGGHDRPQGSGDGRHH